jgi:hypothetical protein
MAPSSDIITPLGRYLILTPADYPEVRAALSPDLDATDLPDDVIGRDVYLGAAEREVVGYDPLAPTRSGIDWIHVRAATVFLTASRLALRLTRITDERFADYLVRVIPQDPQALFASLRAQGLYEMGQISGIDPLAGLLPTQIAVSTARRGDVRPRPWWSPWW